MKLIKLILSYIVLISFIVGQSFPAINLLADDDQFDLRKNYQNLSSQFNTLLIHSK